MQSNPIRTLARSTQYQALYIHAKNLKYNLFENISNFSYIQLLFLQWLEVYHNIYLDMIGEDTIIDEEILEDDILVDAYLFYKKYKNKIDKANSKLPIKNTGCQIPSLTFIQRRKNK
jgi:hypothetical protein